MIDATVVQSPSWPRPCYSLYVAAVAPTELA